MDLRRVVGENVKLYRASRKLSQEELGFRARLDRTYISGVERGIRNPTVLALGKIGKALKVPAWALLQPMGSKNQRLG